MFKQNVCLIAKFIMTQTEWDFNAAIVSLSLSWAARERNMQNNNHAAVVQFVDANSAITAQRIHSIYIRTSCNVNLL